MDNIQSAQEFPPTTSISSCSTFDKLYDQFTDLEKKTFMNSFIERIEIFPERQRQWTDS